MPRSCVQLKIPHNAIDGVFGFMQAFAWFSDLLVEHADIFWSLFAVDMTAVLDQQPEDQWDTFPLFQLLNDYLRLDGMPTLAVIGSHSENLLARSRKSL